MKKVIFWFLVFPLLFIPVVFAQMPLNVPAVPLLSSRSFEKIGVVAAAQGQVELKTPGQVGRIAQSGQPVFMGDEVKTDAKGHLQILLLDETVFTIGPDSAIIIDKFVYDPKSHEGEIKASITKGIFRYVSGKIAAKRPNNVTLKLPAATIGFRGTIVAGSVGTDGQGVAALLGPGDNNDSGERTGSFTINGDKGGRAEVNRTGFGVEMGAGGELSGVFKLSSDQVNGLTQGLMPLQGQGNGPRGPDGGEGGPRPLFSGGENMGKLSGEMRAGTFQNGKLTNLFGMLLDRIDDQSNQVAQDFSSNAPVRPDTTKIAELMRLVSGIYHYSASGNLFSSSGSNVGSISASWDLVINQNRVVMGGGSSSVTVSGSGGYPSETASISPLNLTNKIDAVMHQGATGNFQSIDIALKNVNGVIGGNGTVNVLYSNGSTLNNTHGQASGPRSPGASS